jgi:hypothetical protein
MRCPSGSFGLRATRVVGHQEGHPRLRSAPPAGPRSDANQVPPSSGCSPRRFAGGGGPARRRNAPPPAGLPLNEMVREFSEDGRARRRQDPPIALGANRWPIQGDPGRRQPDGAGLGRNPLLAVVEFGRWTWDNGTAANEGREDSLIRSQELLRLYQCRSNFSHQEVEIPRAASGLMALSHSGKEDGTALGDEA